jgi:phosphoadenosine phosphosulfate reductase
LRGHKASLWLAKFLSLTPPFIQHPMFAIASSSTVSSLSDRPGTVPVASVSASANAGTSAISLYGRASSTFADKIAQTLALLQSAAKNYAPLVQASSLGAEDMVLTHLITQAGLPIPAFVLETGRLHAETLALLADLKAQMGERLQSLHPEPLATEAFTHANGLDAMYKSPELRKACCQLRKLEPLERALRGQKAWLTGLRREQSGSRADVPFVDESELATKGRVKINPLAAWTWGDIWHYIALHKVPYNLLHDQFYPSIGCEPCTRAISVGEDFRSGRWWWESSNMKECGLHSKAHAGDSQHVAASAPANFAYGEVKDAQASGQSQNTRTKECGLHGKSHIA